MEPTTERQMDYEQIVKDDIDKAIDNLLETDIDECALVCESIMASKVIVVVEDVEEKDNFLRFNILVYGRRSVRLSLDTSHRPDAFKRMTYVESVSPSKVHQHTIVKMKDIIAFKGL